MSVLGPEHLKALDLLAELLDKVCEKLLRKFNQHHDQSGRFASGPDTGGAYGGGISQSRDRNEKPDRASRAKRSYKESTREKQEKADKWQAKVAKLIRGRNIPGDDPFDVLLKGDTEGVEVKTLQDNDNNKITMHPPSRRRKLEFAKKNKLKKIHTVIVDIRKGENKPVYYYMEGVGSFRIGKRNKPVSLKELKEIFK